jgi:transposase
MAKNKKWSSVAKLEIAQQAIKSETTLSQLCKKHEVSPAQVHTCRNQLLDQAAQLFNKADNSAKIFAQHEQTQRFLFEKIG